MYTELKTLLSCCTLRASQPRLLLSSSQPCSLSPNSLTPIRLLGPQQSGFMGWCCTWVWCFQQVWCLIKCCAPASQPLRLLWISRAFIWAQGSLWTWEAQRQHPLSTQMEREIPSGLYKPLQIYKGFCPALSWGRIGSHFFFLRASPQAVHIAPIWLWMPASAWISQLRVTCAPGRWAGLSQSTDSGEKFLFNIQLNGFP